MESELTRRVDRLEAYEQIRQLAARYTLAVDSRDLDTLVSLFVEDIRVAPGEHGRAALKEWFRRSLNQFTSSIHFCLNHVIDLVDDGHAQGFVYGRTEHEVGEQWIVQTMIYDDKYERRDGRWYFVRRRTSRWYATDVTERPLGEHRLRFPGRPLGPAQLPNWPTYDAFWTEEAARK